MENKVYGNDALKKLAGYNETNDNFSWSNNVSNYQFFSDLLNSLDAIDKKFDSLEEKQI